MKNSVEIIDEEARCGTFAIAKGFKRDHHRLLALIEKYEIRFLRLEQKPFMKALLKRRIPQKKAGRPIDELLLNESQVFFLSSILRASKEALDFKESLSVSFSHAVILLNKVDKALKAFDFDNINVKFVYAAQDNHGRIKIGISNDPYRRLRELNSGHPDELQLIYIKEACGKGYSDEINMHNKCSDYNIRSEWFTCEAKKYLNVNDTYNTLIES